MCIAGPHILSAGILDHLSYRTATTRNIPYGTYLFVNHHRTALACLLCLLLQGMVVLVNDSKKTIGLLLTTEEQTIEAHPLSPGQR